MHTSADGAVSFRKKGRIEAAFIRLETNNLVVLAMRAGFVTIASTNLSEADRTYVVRAAGIDSPEPAQPDQSPMVRNEMARRRREAEKLREDALDKRRLAHLELEAADDLEKEASQLVNQANNIEAGAHGRATCFTSTTPVNASAAASFSTPFGGHTNIEAAAASQLKLDIARLYQQAKEKRGEAARLQKEAASLEQAAQAEEASSMAYPTSAR